MSTCGWCSKPAVAERVLEPEQPRRRRRDGRLVEELVRPARTVGVCAEHAGIFERAEKVRVLLEQRASLQRRRRSPQANVSHIDHLLEEVAGRLRELGYVETGGVAAVAR